MQLNVIEETAGANMQCDYIRRRRMCIKGDKIIVRSLSVADLVRRDALLKPYYTISETINPYLPNGLCHPYQVDESDCHLMAVRCLVSFLFYFEHDYL